MPILRKICRWSSAKGRGSHLADGEPVLRKIVLHIGVEKTGTKTLQLALAINRRLLQQYGYVFPAALESSFCNHTGLAIWAAANPDAVLDLRQYAGLKDGEDYAAFQQRYPAQIAQELAESGGHTAILSNEHCSSRLGTIAEIKKLRGLIAPLARECRVVIYLRRQDELVASHYSTSVKSGATHKFDFPKGVEWLDYLRLLEMWSEVFNKENIDVRIFEPQQMKNGDLFADFFSTIGFTRYEELLRPEDQNRSLDVYTVEFLRRFNAHVPIRAESGLCRDRGDVEGALEAITSRDCLRPSAEAAAAFLGQFAASNEEVARRFLNRGDGILFTTAPLRDQPARLPTLDVDRAMAISVALWQWQEARLRASPRNDRVGIRREALSPLIPSAFRNRRGRLFARGA